MEAGARIFPETAAAPGQATILASTAANSVFSSDFVATFPLVYSSAPVASSVAETVGQAVDVINGIVADATAMMNVVSVLQGAIGRFFGQIPIPGSAAVLMAAITALTSAAEIGSMIGVLTAEASASRSTSSAACSALAAASTSSPPSGIAGAIQSAVASCAGAVSPEDGLRLLPALTAFVANPPPATDPMGQARSAAQTAVAALIRQSALSALAVAAVQFQPSSYDQAIAIRDQVSGALDTEALTAADGGLDASYLALQSLRAAVVQDLTSAGAGLAPLIEVSFSASLPSLTLAQRLYQDAARAPELVSEADVPHPAFMPLAFMALSR